MASKLIASARYISPLPPESWLLALNDRVEPLEGGFQLVSKLSGGGVVVRALRAPETKLPWFGTLKGSRFSIASIPQDKSASPFQPILRGEVRPQGEGCAVALELAPHPGARTFSGLFVFGGVLLGLASLLALSQGQLVGGVAGLCFAAIFLAFPNLRAQVGFDYGCEGSLKAFEAAFDVTPDPMGP